VPRDAGTVLCALRLPPERRTPPRKGPGVRVCPLDSTPAESKGVAPWPVEVSADVVSVTRGLGVVWPHKGGRREKRAHGHDHTHHASSHRLGALLWSFLPLEAASPKGLTTGGVLTQLGGVVAARPVPRQSRPSYRISAAAQRRCSGSAPPAPDRPRGRRASTVPITTIFAMASRVNG
jgi:hypothetical protein